MAPSNRLEGDCTQPFIYPGSYENTRHGAIRHWAAPVAGLLAGIYATHPAHFFHPPPFFIRSWVALWALASRSTLRVFLFAVVVLLIVSLLVRDRSSWAKRRDMALDIGAAVTWLSPIGIFAWRATPWFAFATVVFVAALARAILQRASAWQEIQWDKPGRRLPAFLLALAIESSFVVGSAYDWRLAAPLFALTTCGAVWLLTATAVWPLKPPSGRDRSPIRAVPALFLAITFSAGGWTPYMASGGNASAPSDDLKPSWRGVMLLPVSKPKTALPAAPVPRKTGGQGSATAKATSIPFNGAYYFFRGPGLPPVDPHRSFGEATDISFRSTDGLPLAMEARETFENPIDIARCRQLQLAVRNSDRKPGTVRVEVLLRSRDAFRVVSLGSQPVLSSPLEDGPPASEVLSYSLSKTKLSSFDTIQIVFHLLNPRIDRSAKIAVDRIVLVR